MFTGIFRKRISKGSSDASSSSSPGGINRDDGVSPSSLPSSPGIHVAKTSEDDLQGLEKEIADLKFPLDATGMALQELWDNLQGANESQVRDCLLSLCFSSLKLGHRMSSSCDLIFL